MDATRVGEGGTPSPSAVGGVVEDDQFRVAARVADGQSTRRCNKAGVVHAEWLQQPFPHQLIKPTPGGAGEQNAEHGIGQFVSPYRPGLFQQRQLGEPGDQRGRNAGRSPNVIWIGTPPPRFFTQTCGVPAASLMNATMRPSGERLGQRCDPAKVEINSRPATAVLA